MISMEELAKSGGCDLHSDAARGIVLSLIKRRDFIQS